MKKIYFWEISTQKRVIHFWETYNLSNLIKESTCFKNPHNPSTIDLILTNRPRVFLNSTIIETGLYAHHKLTVTIMRSFFQKQATIKSFIGITRISIKPSFATNIIWNYTVHKDKVNYDTFEEIVVKLLNIYAVHT